MFLELYKIIEEAFKGKGRRSYVMIVIFILLFLWIVIRLFILQIINGDYYVENYVQKSVKYVTIPAARGNIYDKNGQILAYNELIKNVTIADVDAYKANTDGINKRNLMLLKLAKILTKHGANIDSKYFVEIDDDNNFHFTTEREKQHTTFIANVYGRLVKDLDEGQNYRFPSNITAKEAFEYSKKRYAMDVIKDEKGRVLVIDNKTLLNMIGIHFTMRLTSYQKYQPTIIAQNVSNRCAGEIEENIGELKGVSIEETSRRQYNYSTYFAHIIGYTGKTSEENINALKEEYDQYDINDYVGLLGIEKSQEQILRGTKGYRKIVVDSGGKILEVLEEQESRAGNDIYLSIAAEDQVADYHLLEQELSGVLASKIVNEEVDKSKEGSSGMRIQASDAFYKLIDNYVLDKEHFQAYDAKMAEKEIYRLFQENKRRARQEIYNNLMQDNPPIQKNLTQEMQGYLAYIYTYLHTNDNILMSDKINRDVEEYIAWKEDEISLKNFLEKAIEELWIDTTKIYATNRYGNRKEIYDNLVQYIMLILEDNDEFDNLVYMYQIRNKNIPSKYLLMALFEQGFFEWNQVDYDILNRASDTYCYDYFIRLIRDLKLKASDLALDPYAGSVVVTDAKTGKIKTLVTYPSYDNNRITEKKYLDRLNKNKSYPLVSCSTQTQLAPGSSFKPITALASLEEGVIDEHTELNCTGEFDEIDPPIKCWAYPYSHGKLDLIGALSNSCNFIFALLGHELSKEKTIDGKYDKDGVYSTDTGLRIIIKYATMFGLNEKSGVEIDEMAPHISREDPERSAMGQGTHTFNNCQLAKYTVCLANGGTLYNLSVLDKIMDKKGNTLEVIEPKFVNKLDVKKENIQTVKDGMRSHITDGIVSLIFKNQGIQICGKTGTAQERKDRTNHATFVSFAPYYDPDTCVNVVIPFGYSSGNAAVLANRIYNYHYGVLSFEKIINQNADNIRSISVSD